MLLKFPFLTYSLYNTIDIDVLHVYVGGENVELSDRQNKIIDIVKENGPITGEKIANQLSLTRATLRPDLAILTMAGFLDARPRVGYFYTGKTGLELLIDRLKKLQVKDYHSVPVVIKEHVSVYDAIVTMFLEDVGTLFVIDEEQLLVGVLSRKDLLRASMGQQKIKEIPVHIIMTRVPKIKFCFKEDALIDAAAKLIENQIDRSEE